jgi:excisionase family DNA binding protein
VPSISEAAAQLGCSVDTVRRRIRDGSLAAQKVDGHWEVELPVETFQEEHGNGVEGLERVIEVLQAEVEMLRRQVESKDQQIFQLHQLLAARQLTDGGGRSWWKFWQK